MQRVSRMALWNFYCFNIFCPPYYFKCILLVNWIMIYVLSCSNRKNKLILCAWVCFIITLVWHSCLLVCVSLAPRCCSLLGKTPRLTVSVYLQMYSGVKHKPHETGVICSEKLLLNSTLNFTSTPQLFSTRNVGMHSPNPYPDRWEKKKMREKASNKAARGYRRL